VSASCSNNCPSTAVFPRIIDNRPGLPRVSFRIGAYSDFRQALFSGLDTAPLLLPWTHRQADDPGIALLEGVAILGDILTFYQELYANEVWLRTATWPESVTALVRLLGYRPAPGIAGESTVAFEFKGAAAVSLAAGFGFNAKITTQPKPVDFETSADLQAVPQLSRFSLYAPWKVTSIGIGTRVVAVDTSALTAAGVTLKAKDRLALVDPVTVADAESVNWQISVVQSVAVILDQTVITLIGEWRGNTPPSGTLVAYKLGRSFHAFGYNAPASQLSISSGTASTTAVNTNIALPQILDAFPLERKVDDLSAGCNILVDLRITNAAGQTEEFLLATKVFRAYLGSDTVGPLSGSVTLVELQTGHAHTGNPVNADRRTAQCLEVVGSPFNLTGPRVLAGSGGVDHLLFYGDGATYQQLNGRLLQFAVLNADDSVAQVEHVAATIDPAYQPSDLSVGFRTVLLNPALQEFGWSDFPLANPGVTVFGNVVAVTQGKTQPQAVLGDGDARQTNQTFKVPKGPLTWLSDTALTPPRTPQLQVLVNGLEWEEVESLFGAGPTDRVYIIRLDDSGDSWIQFGDGNNGARLPSGIGNLQITNRSGVGANGKRIPGTNPAPAGQAPGLKAIRLYEPVVGGAAPESSDSARQAAPGRIQSLGRLVSLSDFEFEALLQPGVEKAQAVWDLSSGVPLLVLTVLLAEPSDTATDTVQAAMSLANMTRGSQRFQVQVQAASLLYVYVNLTFGLSQGYQPATVKSAIASALGVIPVVGSAQSGGLFSEDQRGLGGPEYASRIEGVVQNIEGVAWVEVTAFDQLGSADDPSTLSVPSVTALQSRLPCAANQVLALYGAHFNASPSSSAKGASV
jgi:hypothetical protein